VKGSLEDFAGTNSHAGTLAAVREKLEKEKEAADSSSV
jgi:hypothetical protein